MKIPGAVNSKFRELFGGQPLLVRSPGRVNLIGEHTDYNHGYVLPAAIDKAITFAISARDDRRSIIHALDLNDEHEFDMSEVHFSQKGWPNYLMGIIDQLNKAGYCAGGFNCVFGGDIPIGAGLSSSAAIEAGLAFALRNLFDLRIDDLGLVKLAQRAENEFVGVQCGIMDQFINIFGERDKVLRIDCRSLQHKYFEFDHDVAIVLFDTCVSHSLASSEYNRRREECSEGVAVISKTFPQVTHLRDVSCEMLQARKDCMNPTIYRRCKYVVEENDRVLKACQALQEKQLRLFGKYMFETHEGLSSDYNVSCEELDCLVELVKDDPRVYGARMMGGGFGGCTINLIKPEGIGDIGRVVAEKYEQRFDLAPKMYVTSISAGTEIISLHEDAGAKVG